jgi:hypothetical protein
MTGFSDKDLNRTLSSKELSQISERDLTKLSFLRNLKNLISFGGGAVIVSYIAVSFGKFGSAIGWIAIIILCLLALEPLFAFLTTLISLLPSLSGRRWKFVQLLISGITTIIYIGFVVLIYVRVIHA